MNGSVSVDIRDQVGFIARFYWTFYSIYIRRWFGPAVYASLWRQRTCIQFPFLIFSTTPLGRKFRVLYFYFGKNKDLTIFWQLFDQADIPVILEYDIEEECTYRTDIFLITSIFVVFMENNHVRILLCSVYSCYNICSIIMVNFKSAIIYFL